MTINKNKIMVKKEFVLRMYAERTELQEKMVKLNNFMATPEFKLLPIVKQSLLRDQSKAMNDYFQILTVRLELEDDVNLQNEAVKEPKDLKDLN